MPEDVLEVPLEPTEQPAAEAITSTLDDQFWVDYVDAQHDFHIFVAIALGMIIGLLCAQILKRG